jgi:hypothetical protein
MLRTRIWRRAGIAPRDDGTLPASPRYLPMTDQQTVPNRLSPAERAERNLMRQQDAEKAMAEHEHAQAALYANMERLRAERLKREAAGEAKAPPVRRTKRAAGARA